MGIDDLVRELGSGGWLAMGGELFAPQGEYDFANVVDCSLELDSLRIVLECRGNRSTCSLQTRELEVTSAGDPPIQMALVELSKHRLQKGFLGGKNRSVLMNHVSLFLEHVERCVANPHFAPTLVGKPLNAGPIDRMVQSFLRQHPELVSIDVAGDEVVLRFATGSPITVALHVVDGRPALALGGCSDEGLRSILARRR
jgi:hypothetical protein